MIDGLHGKRACPRTGDCRFDSGRTKVRGEKKTSIAHLSSRLESNAARALSLFAKQRVRETACVSSTLLSANAPVAQRLERMPYKRLMTGSIPARCTMRL